MEIPGTEFIHEFSAAGDRFQLQRRPLLTRGWEVKIRLELEVSGGRSKQRYLYLEEDVFLILQRGESPLAIDAQAGPRVNYLAVKCPGCGRLDRIVAGNENRCASADCRLSLSLTGRIQAMISAVCGGKGPHGSEDEAA